MIPLRGVCGQRLVVREARASDSHMNALHLFARDHTPGRFSLSVAIFLLQSCFAGTDKATSGCRLAWSARSRAGAWDQSRDFWHRGSAQPCNRAQKCTRCQTSPRTVRRQRPKTVPCRRRSAQCTPTHACTQSTVATGRAHIAFTLVHARAVVFVAHYCLIGRQVLSHPILCNKVGRVAAR
jgi:hypothetical protein